MSTQQPESLQLAHIFDHPIPPDWSDMVAAVRELLRLHAENEALQQVYDARQLEIDHLRGVTKSKLLAQPASKEQTMSNDQMRGKPRPSQERINHE